MLSISELRVEIEAMRAVSAPVRFDVMIVNAGTGLMLNGKKPPSSPRGEKAVRIRPHGGTGRDIRHGYCPPTMPQIEFGYGDGDDLGGDLAECHFQPPPGP